MKTRLFHSLFILGVLLSTGRCGPAIDLEMLNAASAQLVQVTSDYPGVVMVALPGGRGMCTGTFISTRAVLTASHCTQEEGTYRIYASFGRFETSTRQKLGAGELHDPSDLAILVMSTDVADPAQGQVIPLGEQPTAGTEIRLVGFGCNDLETRLGAGAKRTGTNHVYEVTDFLELLSTPVDRLAEREAAVSRVLGPENQAASCFGDSGGPMLANQDGLLKVVGVAHAGGRDGNLIRSLYVNLNGNTNHGFLKDMDGTYSLQLFDGCWTSSDSEACGPDTASFNLFAFLKQLFVRIWSLF